MQTQLVQVTPDRHQFGSCISSNEIVSDMFASPFTDPKGNNNSSCLQLGNVQCLLCIRNLVVLQGTTHMLILLFGEYNSIRQCGSWWLSDVSTDQQPREQTICSKLKVREKQSEQQQFFQLSCGKMVELIDNTCSGLIYF